MVANTKADSPVAMEDADQTLRLRAIDRLRALVPDCMSKHMGKAAIFFASKLCSMSGNQPNDVYLLAQAYYVSKQYRRAHALLNKPELLARNMRYRYLAALCMAACLEWEGCLAIIGSDDIPETLAEKNTGVLDSQGWQINMYSAVCLLRGRVYDALDNRSRAVNWYKAALQSDPFCYEAYVALVEHHMLSNSQELEFLQSLDISTNDRWLSLLYLTMCKKYQKPQELEARLRTLEDAPTEAAGESKLSPSGHRASEDLLRRLSGVPDLSKPPPLSNNAADRDKLQQDVQLMDDDDGAEVLEHRDSACSSLAQDFAVRSARAECLCRRGDPVAAYRECHSIVQQDPRALECMPVYLACMVELSKKNELFQLGHRLVQDYSDNGISWYAVGCYYLSVGQFDLARRLFGKATQLSPRQAHSWLAYGHAYALQDESDQALVAYRTSARLFPGLHEPLLGMGREYQHMNNPILAEQMFLQVCTSR
jgi:anaphase-promoting complex subunit 6